jgi:hypothetical protein
MYEHCSRHPGDAGYRFLKALSLEIREPMGEVVESDEAAASEYIFLRTVSMLVSPSLLDWQLVSRTPLQLQLP